MRLWAPRVLGLDLSLTGTGICRIGDGVEFLTTVRPAKVTGHARIQVILDAIHAAHSGQGIDLVVIEGPSYGSQGGQRGHHERAGLWWMVSHSLWRHSRPYAVVSPMGRAKYATGRGDAKKSDVLAAMRARYGHLLIIGDDNQADALALAAMGVDHCGGSLGVVVPDVNRETFRAVEWPLMPSDE